MIRKVVIAGGGTAGWMAAAALSGLLGKNLHICLISSEEIPVVGVGEATIPTLNAFHKLLNIPEDDFLRSVQGTFKLGIAFENWYRTNHRYLHAFGSTRADSWAAGFQHYWLKSRQRGNPLDYGHYSIESLAAAAGKFSTHIKTDRGSEPLVYAWHFDAGLYAAYLEKYAARHGVVHRKGTIRQVHLDPDSGHISSLELNDGERIEGDLFIDCTGFRSLLLDRTLHVGYEDWTHWLPCDRAVAMQTSAVSEPLPYTRSIAHSAGWQWQIPLQHRVGNGLVYSSRYLSDEAATECLLSSVEGEPLTTPRYLQFRTGQRRKHWHKNCIALGLASGFLEPLESTAIHFVQKNLIRLIQMFPQAGISDAVVTEFNRQCRAEMENVRDFIILHYHATAREDSPFWRYCKTMEIPESLQSRLSLFREAGRFYRDSWDLFGESSWVQVLLGQGVMPDDYHPLVNLMSDAELDSFMRQAHAKAAEFADVLPTHQELIHHYCRASAQADNKAALAV